MRHYGDITKLSGYDLPVVDVITGGSPCQDLSVAGNRAGLAGERSGLFMEQIRIVKEMREHDRATGRTDWMVRPRYMVWENVPGAFSSNGGKDFQTVLEEIVGIVEEQVPDLSDAVKGGWTKAGCIYDELGAWSLAWRVHDTQFWGCAQYVDGRMLNRGTPQRRKRIALVADFGGLSAPDILFERKGLHGTHEEVRAIAEGLQGNLEPRGAEGKETPGRADEGADVTGGVVTKGNGEAFLTPEKHMSPTVGGGQAGQGYPAVLQAEPIPIHDQATRFKGKHGNKSDGKGNGLGIGKPGEPTNTLSSGDRHAVCAAFMGGARE